MSKTNNTIEINGKRYDAKTGALLDSAAVERPVAHTSKPSAAIVKRSAAKPSVSHAPSPSRTLMRKAVKKPDPSLKRWHKAQGHTDVLATRGLSPVIVKPSALRLDEQRLRHAKQIERSRLISRFPALTSDAFARDNLPAPQALDSRALRPPAMPATTTASPKQPRTTNDLLERAIARSTSHLEPPHKPVKRSRDGLKRNASIGAAIGLSVIVLGVIVTQNLANVRLQMASAKAGFNVSLPNYRPAGYGLGQLNYNEGVAAVQFHSNSDDRHYTITQKRSEWTSTDLRNNFIAPSYARYQTVQAGGLTIYLYDNHSATWVNNGVWYVIQSDGSLSDHQLVDLATSL